MSFVEKYVIFGLIADVRTEIFANATVPVRPVLLVKLFLDVFGHQILSLEVVDRPFCLD